MTQPASCVGLRHLREFRTMAINSGFASHSIDIISELIHNHLEICLACQPPAPEKNAIEAP